MDGRQIRRVTAGIVAVGLLVWFVTNAFQPSSSEVSSALAKEERGSEDQVRFVSSNPVSELEPIPTESSSREVRTPLQSAFERVEQVLVGTSTIPGDSSTYEAKYRNLSDSEVIAALRLLVPIQEAERQRIVDERLASGVFEQHVVNAGERIPSPKLEDGTMPSFGWSIEPLGEKTLVKLTIIRPEEYPEYHGLELEVGWLRNKVHALGVPAGSR